MANNDYETLTLNQAADFLKLHWQTLRSKAKCGEVPAAKLGRRWVFLREDLVSYLRSNYSTGRPRSQVQQSVGDSLCCTNDPIRVSGGARSKHRMESEYNNLLKR
ncbi:MAG: helix-turn-helix domain-containing protein [Gammaproteobacteria bacterium]|nr:helix-turn-helix domain-containing protein [Gammaproteobacteria bacterium]